MKPVLRPLLLAVLACALPFPGRAAAQGVDTASASADSVHVVHLSDGSVLYGRVVADSGAVVVVRTGSGVTVRLERGQIASMTQRAARVVAGRVWPEDPNRTRLFFGPTARPLGAGRGYLGVYEVLFPFVTYGVSESFSLSGGTPLVPGAIGRVWYFAPKLTLASSDGGAVAAGALVGGTGDGTGGIVYGVGTVGGADHAVTAGAGWAFGDGIGGDPVLMLGGETRIGAGSKLVTENYLIPGIDGPLTSVGVRLFGEHLSADLGIGTVLGTDCTDFCWVPLVNFVYSFSGESP